MFVWCSSGSGLELLGLSFDWERIVRSSTIARISHDVYTYPVAFRSINFEFDGFSRQNLVLRVLVAAL